MLKLLRNRRNQKVIYVVITILILPAFLIWGVLVDNKGDNSSMDLGRLESRKITVKDYLASYRAISRQLQWAYGDRAKELLPLLNIKGEAWDRILLLEYAKRNKIKATDDEVIEWLSNQSIFVQNGQFNNQLYKRYITEYLRTDTRQFEEEMRGTLTIEKIREKVKSEITVDESQVRPAFDEENASYNLTYAVLAAAEKQEETNSAVKKLTDAQPTLTGENFDATLTGIGAVVKSVEKSKLQDYLEGLGPGAYLKATLKTMTEGQISQPIALPTNGAVIVKLNMKYLPTEEEFTAQKDVFAKQLLDKQADEKMRTLLDGERAKLNLNLELMKKIFADEQKSR